MSKVKMLVVSALKGEIIKMEKVLDDSIPKGIFRYSLNTGTEKMVEVETVGENGSPPDGSVTVSPTLGGDSGLAGKESKVDLEDKSEKSDSAPEKEPKKSDFASGLKGEGKKSEDSKSESKRDDEPIGDSHEQPKDESQQDSKSESKEGR